jgi:hypothetical protein
LASIVLSSLLLQLAGKTAPLQTVAFGPDCVGQALLRLQSRGAAYTQGQIPWACWPLALTRQGLRITYGPTDAFVHASTARFLICSLQQSLNNASDNLKRELDAPNRRLVVLHDIVVDEGIMTQDMHLGGEQILGAWISMPYMDSDHGYH